MREKLTLTEEGCEEEEEEEECPICLNELEGYGDDGEDDDSQRVVEVACHHRFHQGCLAMWERKSMERRIPPLCPLCRGHM